MPLRRLAGHSAIYGAADVLGTAVNFLLLPVYLRYLAPSDYGTLALLLLFSTVARMAFRLQLDGAFFRIHYDLDDPAERRRLAGTVSLFAAGVATVLGLLVLVAQGPLTHALFGVDTGIGRRLLLLAAADVFLGTFVFVPLNLLRTEGRPALFSAFTLGRQLLNTVLKVVLLWGGHGVEGVLWSDLAATAVLTLALLPLLRSRVEWTFSRELLRPVLAFALPKVPHGVFVQALSLADRRILDVFVSLAEIGVYHVASTFASGVKFALSAFEPAWAPFVYAEARNKNAPGTLARIATPVFAGFVAAGTGMAVLGPELVAFMTPGTGDYRAAGPLVPVLALAYVLHGLFLLTSVGIGIARDTRWYARITALAVAANIAANFLLIPSMGIAGAAWATVLAYALMAGLGALASARAYAIPFEWGALLALLASGVACALLSTLAPADLWGAVAAKAGLLAVYVGGLGLLCWQRLKAVTP